jgi:hypothetical protein
MKTILFGLFICQLTVAAQVVPFTSSQWKFKNNDYKLQNYLGKEAVLLKKNMALLEGADFENGVIEYDMAFPDSRAFIGFHFRIEDQKNYEEFYVRPHQSGNPDANQYTPVFGGNAGWQLYYGEGYGAPVKYHFNRWMHYKLVVSGQYMEVYIEDMETPVLFAELKRRTLKGNIAIQNSINESYFANVSIVQDDRVMLKNKPKPAEPIAVGTITTWLISKPFAEKTLENIHHLKELKFKPEYSSHGVEHTGTLNLSKTAEVGEETNMVLAKVTIASEKEQIKKLLFGFSDRVTVFVNGSAIFHGEDNFASRDYRFLGTIGYYDAIYLPLRKGDNEIIFAIAENFGGWGIKAKLENMEGVTLGR